MSSLNQDRSSKNKPPQMNERDYFIALWRLKKHRVPDRFDWLHDAVLEYYEKNPQVAEGKLGNWLGLVAWRKWQDHKKKWSTRMVKSSELLDLRPAKTEEKLRFDWSKVMGCMTEKQLDTFTLWLSGLNQPQSAKSVGVCTSAMNQRRKSLLRFLKKRITKQ